MGDVLTMDEHHEILTDAIAATDPIGAEIAARKIDLHDAALRARIAELEAEVAKWEAAARSAHSRVEFLEAEVERLTKERDSAVGTSEKFARDKDRAWAAMLMVVEERAAVLARAEAAEAREAGLREALASLIPCAYLGKCGCDAYTEHEHFTGACGPVVQLKPTGKPCRCEACLARAALAAAPDKEGK